MSKIDNRRPFYLASALLGAALATLPFELGSEGFVLDTAAAVHDVNDGNNGHGDNRRPDGSKVDDASNPNYQRSGDDPLDGNSGIGDDKERGDKAGKGSKKK